MSINLLRKGETRLLMLRLSIDCDFLKEIAAFVKVKANRKTGRELVTHVVESGIGGALQCFHAVIRHQKAF